MLNDDFINAIAAKDRRFRVGIYVDVDGTLINPDMSMNMVLVDELRTAKEQHGDKICIVVWSTGGQGHAQKAAWAAGIEGIVEACLPKPHYLIDDMGKDLWHFNRIVFIDDFPQKKSTVPFKG